MDLVNSKSDSNEWIATNVTKLIVYPCNPHSTSMRLWREVYTENSVYKAVLSRPFV